MNLTVKTQVKKSHFLCVSHVQVISSFLNFISDLMSSFRVAECWCCKSNNLSSKCFKFVLYNCCAFSIKGLIYLKKKVYTLPVRHVFIVYCSQEQIGSGVDEVLEDEMQRSTPTEEEKAPAEEDRQEAMGFPQTSQEVNPQPFSDKTPALSTSTFPFK